ncbi:GntR family transcriptional regulator [Burkholderia vietnamiensis]|uniref:GntR family transcriptional regulator n=1 Tax=Burkholderia vietnamiensis TaxID=60552 RepID=UPI00159423B4|nr:winged helix-turn-helix domain-containing protein [Burkholderia vietnamiensis]MCA8270358.1 winged helix-turn-helix domain-containing protein [Burkholderia vietnamiensis]
MKWIPDISRYGGPAYMAIVTALQDAIANGCLKHGDRLPSQRFLADFLGLHFNTVNRAMRESARRGLTAGNTGRGTLVTCRPGPGR